MMNDPSTDMVEFKANGDMAPGYLARPAGDGPFPGVVVIQEWWGLNDQIKGVAHRLAGAGFVAVVPDFYRGQEAGYDEPNEAQKLAMLLNRKQAAKDIQGAVDYLAAQDYVEPKKIGAIGFCMGGGMAAQMAITGQNVGAVVAFYGGRGVLDEETIPQITAPFLGLYGAKDHSMTVNMVNGWDTAMREAGKTHEIIIYGNAGHAFFNEDRAVAYNKEASEDAWHRTVHWLRMYLK